MSVRFGNTWGLTVQRGPWKPNAYDAGFTVTGQKHAGHGNFYTAERPDTNPTTPYSIPKTKTKTVKYAEGGFIPSTRVGRVQRTYYRHGQRRMAPKQVGLSTTMEDVGTQTADFLGGGTSGSPALTNGSIAGSNNGDNTLYYPSNSEVISPIPIVPGDPAFAISPGLSATAENSFNASTSPMTSSDLGPLVGLGTSVVVPMVNTFEAGLFEDISEPDDDPVDQMWMNGDMAEDQPYLALIGDMVQLYPNSIAAVTQLGGVELANGEQLDAEQAQMLATVVEYYMGYGGSAYPQETIAYLNQQLNDGGMDWVEDILSEFATTGAQPETPGGGGGGVQASGQIPGNFEMAGAEDTLANGDEPTEEYPSGPDLVTDPTTGQPKDGLEPGVDFETTLAKATEIGVARDNFARWLRSNKPESFAAFKAKGGRGTPVFSDSDIIEGRNASTLENLGMAEAKTKAEQQKREELPELVKVGDELFPEGWGPDQFKQACINGTPYINDALFKWYQAWYESKGRSSEFEDLKKKYQNKVAGISVDTTAANTVEQFKNAREGGSNTTNTQPAPDTSASDQPIWAEL